MDVLGFCSTSRSTPALIEPPFLFPLENPVGDTRLIRLSMILLDGKYDIEDCRRPFLTLTRLLAPNGDEGPGGELALELRKAGEREGESDGDERTEPEAS